MKVISFNNIEITGIATCIPEKEIDNTIEGKKLINDQDKLEKTLKTIGVYKRHIAGDNVCTSDLCCYAAEKLIEELPIDKESIDAVLFVSQTPDYITPSTACVLQERLNLSKQTIAYDINLGCSGYIYGLFNAFSIVNIQAVNKVLLLAGDTISKFVSPNDMASSLLFGDAGSATIIEKTEGKKTYFSLNSDGAGKEAIYIPSGGFRSPTTIESLDFSSFPDGSSRNSQQLVLNGGDVFNFTIKEVAKDIDRLLSAAEISKEKVDYFYLHQANLFMLNYLRKKIKTTQEKLPINLDKYGNTSSASIPLIIDMNHKRDNVVLSGFGVGLSWGSCVLDLSNCKILDTIIYE